jgi:hypothetical protein
MQRFSLITLPKHLRSDIPQSLVRMGIDSRMGRIRVNDDSHSPIRMLLGLNPLSQNSEILYQYIPCSQCLNMLRSTE